MGLFVLREIVVVILEKIKAMVQYLVKLFNENHINLLSLVILLEELLEKQPEDTELKNKLIEYSNLEKKLSECLNAIEEGKDSEHLEKELRNVLGDMHPEILNLERVKRWVGFKNNRLVNSEG